MEFAKGFVILNVLLSVVLAASAQLPSQDILALLEFKKGITHDPTGYISASWSAESIDFNGCPSSWNGIICNGGSVAGIILDNLGLAGEANLSVLASLSQLFKLSMANNSLTGTLPSNIVLFQSLKYLDISNNLFSGQLLSDIVKLQNLQNLSLSGNNFSGLLPTEVDGLSSIVFLDLSCNSLSGPLPLALKGLKNLVNLNLSFNLFTKAIPDGLEEISSLQVLDLSWNQLSGDVDWNFLMDSKVVHVDLSGNSLTTSVPTDLKYLSDISDTMSYLNLSHNQLTGSLIDGGGISTFGSLKVLDLSYNQLSGELPGFDYVYDLESLRLSNNHFSGFVPNVLLKGDTLVLNELDLSANNLSGPISWIMSPTLQILNLSGNSISGELPLLTGSCMILDLSNNHLSGNLSMFAKWGNNIEYIDLSCNQFSGPVPDLTSQFLRLNYLNLSHNSLINPLPDVLARYPKLTVLDLGYNDFHGSVPPDLFSSSALQELHLRSNSLSGSLALSGEKSDLRVLDLSTNRFNGSLPDDFESFASLLVLDISANNFTGSLPLTITKLVSLTSLDLSSNEFSGPLPSNLPNTLSSFNVSCNNFSGVVPSNLRKFPDSAFHPGNNDLQLPNSSPGSANSTGGGSSGKPVKAYIKAAIIAGCVVALLILVLIAIIVHYKRVSGSSHHDKVVDKNARKAAMDLAKGREPRRPLVVSTDDLIAPRKGSTSDILSPDEKIAMAVTYSPSKQSRFSWSPDSGDPYTHESLGKFDAGSPDRLAGDLYFLDNTIVLTPEELSRAPAEVLGRSSHGTSYRATLDNGVFLTVKWLREGVAKQKKEFAREAKRFANIRHPNVVGMRGYYWGPTQHEKLILSDYISPGSLASFLYDRPGRKGPPLTWSQRLKIAVDVSRGLNYLHFDRSMPHGNLKATNILLDSVDLNARVSDCCLHRLMTQSGTTEQVLDAGVLGYQAPELTAVKKPSPSFKSDVYAFGIVLLELLTGRCAGDIVSGEEGGGGLEFSDWVRLRVAEGRSSECFDQALEIEMENPTKAGGMKEMLGIAMRCIRPVSDRPGIKSVYEDLSSI